MADSRQRTWANPIMLRLTPALVDRIQAVRVALAKNIYRCAPEEVPRSTVLRWLCTRGLEMTEKEFQIRVPTPARKEPAHGR